VAQVRISNGESYDLEGRAAAIVVWVAEHAPHLDSTDKVRIEFNCAGLTVRPSLTLFEDSLPVTLAKN